MGTFCQIYLNFSYYIHPLEESKISENVRLYNTLKFVNKSLLSKKTFNSISLCCDTILSRSRIRISFTLIVYGMVNKIIVKIEQKLARLIQ